MFTAFQQELLCYHDGYANFFLPYNSNKSQTVLYDFCRNITMNFGRQRCIGVGGMGRAERGWGWFILFYTCNRNWHTFDTMDNRGNSFQFQKDWKSTLGWCTVEVAISKYVRKLWSLAESVRSLRAKIFKITCVYMLFDSKSSGHMFVDLGLTLFGLELVVY